MKKIFVLTLAIFVANILSAQGLKFLDIKYEDAISKAKEENKLVFIDFSMNGCTPCKYMMDKVFPVDSVGELYNNKFIPIYINTSLSDTGAKLAEKFKVTAFPTFIFVNGDGEEIHRSLGGKNAPATIQMGLIALTPNQGSTYLNNQYISGNRDYDFLVDYYLMNYSEGETNKTQAVIADMIRLWGGDLKNPKMSDFFFEYVYQKNNPLSEYFIKNTKEMIERFGKEKVFKKIGELR